MSEDSEEIEKQLKAMADTLVTQNPELASVLDQVRNKPFAEQIQALVPVLSKISETTDLNQLMLYVNAQGTQRLNPKYEAYLAERLQFDGDAPELRTGNIRKGVKPAVPIQTKSKSSVAIGQGLAEASKHMEEQFKALAETVSGTELATLDPKGYERGKMPTPIRVGEMTGAEFISLPLAVQKKLTWGFISTTQGRNTAVPLIADCFSELLKKRGFEVTHTKDIKEMNVVAEQEWSVVLSDGASSVQNNFSYIDIVSKAFVRFYEGSDHKTPFFNISSLNAYSDRGFGWVLTLLEHS